MTRTSHSAAAAFLALAMVFTLWLPTVLVPNDAAPTIALAQLA